MKNLICILFLLIFGISYSQDNNKLIIKFVNDNYGEKVGSGICADLIYKAWEYVDSVNGFRDSIMDDVKENEIKAGDIIEFDSVMYSDGHLMDKHIAIIYHINPNGLLTIAEQNVGSMDDGSMIIYRGEPAPLVKNSHVIFNLIDVSKIVSGKIKFYRI